MLSMLAVTMLNGAYSNNTLRFITSQLCQKSIARLRWLFSSLRSVSVGYYITSYSCHVVHSWRLQPQTERCHLSVYSPKMKGANWLKFICHQGRSLVNNFSLCNNWYKSVVLLLIWLHSLVCQIHNKQMSQLVANSGNICVWVVWCNECGGWQLGRRSAIINATVTHICLPILL